MAIYLVRHTKAGDPAKWTDDDRLRPLTKRGLNQRARLTQRFADIAVSRVVSSPYLRCMQTVEEIAAARGLVVEAEEMLAYAGTFVDVIDLLEQLPDEAVACSHGDIIPDVVAALYRRGMDIVGQEDWRKGTTWVLQRDGSTFTSALVWPPPADD